MSNKNIINATAAAISVMEEALEAARLEHASLSTERIEAKMAAFGEVVRNTRRKMARPAGFDWALHYSFSVITITDTHLKVDVGAARTGERVVIDVPRSDLSLSTWQVTGEIRRQSAERLMTELNGVVTTKKAAATKARKEVTDAEARLSECERDLSQAAEAAERRMARVKAVEAKRAAARARRKERATDAAGVEAADLTPVEVASAS